MSDTNTPARQLYDLLVSQDFDPEALDAEGKPAADPADADIISFDYSTPEKDYGTVVVALDGENNLDMYFGDNMARAMEGDDRSDWYDFLYLVRMFAKRNLLTFNVKNLSRLKYNMKTMAAVKESLFEGYYGNRKISYSDQPNRARLVIKHSKTLGEDDARFRHIESLYVENADGERFRVPSRSLTHGRMLARHVAEGGTPYDPFGIHITEIVDEMKTLSNFVRAAKHRDYTGEAAHMVEAAIRHYADLKAKAKKMIGRRGYHEARDAFDPAEITEIDEAVETIRELFVRQTLDPRVEQALPVLARLQEQDSLPEAEVFETWAQRMMEGTWAIPETPEQVKKLQALMSQELIVGPDASNATEQLYDIVGDDELFDRLEALARINPDANVWDDPRVMARLEQLGVPTQDAIDLDSVKEGQMKRMAMGDIQVDVNPQGPFDVIRRRDGIESSLRQHATQEQAQRHAQNLKKKYPSMEVGIRPAGQKTQYIGIAEEKHCNHTTEGVACPVHGMAECAMEESQELDRLRDLALG